jgi:L-aspartate oxidase
MALLRSGHLFSLNLEHLPTYQADFLIIGSGIAGLFAAYKAQTHGSVMVVTKERMEDSNTEKAQGGIAVAVDEADSPFFHLEDTLEAGAGLCNRAAAEILVTEGPMRVMELVDLGVNFDRQGSAWSLGREGAHRRRRILHASDATGGEIARALIRECRQLQGIELREGCQLVDFLREPGSGRCSGALVLDQGTGEFAVYRGRVVIVATGGGGQLYRYTTNPEVATGDGMAAAYRSGAELMDMEFVQFHPTVLAIPGAPRFLISEAVRGEGAKLRNVKGERFMLSYHQMQELAPRDVVSRAIVREMIRTQVEYVYLDITHLDRAHFQNRFPNIWRTCQYYGVDLAKGYIPVSPAAHYLMGGIRTNENGETNIPGLYACGEVACDGVHGANRLASNSLLEGLVFGARAIAAGCRFLELNREFPAIPKELQGSSSSVSQVAATTCPHTQQPVVCGDRETMDQTQLIPESLWGEIAGRVRDLMWDKAGIIREQVELQDALVELARTEALITCYTPSRQAVEAASLLTLGRLTLTAAMMRGESRGGHFRRDYPARDDVYWMRHITFSL